MANIKTTLKIELNRSANLVTNKYLIGSGLLSISNKYAVGVYNVAKSKPTKEPFILGKSKLGSKEVFWSKTQKYDGLIIKGSNKMIFEKDSNTPFTTPIIFIFSKGYEPLEYYFWSDSTTPSEKFPITDNVVSIDFQIGTIFYDRVTFVFPNDYLPRIRYYSKTATIYAESGKNIKSLKFSSNRLNDTEEMRPGIVQQYLNAEITLDKTTIEVLNAMAPIKFPDKTIKVTQTINDKILLNKYAFPIEDLQINTKTNTATITSRQIPVERNYGQWTFLNVKNHKNGSNELPQYHSVYACYPFGSKYLNGEWGLFDIKDTAGAYLRYSPVLAYHEKNQKTQNIPVATIMELSFANFSMAPYTMALSGSGNNAEFKYFSEACFYNTLLVDKDGFYRHDTPYKYTVFNAMPTFNMEDIFHYSKGGLQEKQIKNYCYNELNYANFFYKSNVGTGPFNYNFLKIFNKYGIKKETKTLPKIEPYYTQIGNKNGVNETAMGRGLKEVGFLMGHVRRSIKFRCIANEVTINLFKSKILYKNEYYFVAKMEYEYAKGTAWLNVELLDWLIIPNRLPDGLCSFKYTNMTDI